jgi:hypothetical protein
MEEPKTLQTPKSWWQATSTSKFLKSEYIGICMTCNLTKKSWYHVYNTKSLISLKIAWQKHEKSNN